MEAALEMHCNIVLVLVVGFMVLLTLLAYNLTVVLPGLRVTAEHCLEVICNNQCAAMSVLMTGNARTCPCHLQSSALDMAMQLLTASIWSAY